MRHTKVNKLICSLLVCSMVFASGVFVYAEGTGELVDNMRSATLVQKAPAQNAAKHRHVGLKAAIDKLVEEGKLSKEKAEQIDKFVRQKIEEQRKLSSGDKQDLIKGHKYRLINDLVKANIINEAEAESIKNKLREMKEISFNEKLSVMVQKGTITQAQADKVKLYFESARTERIEQFKKLQGMTKEQRESFFKEHKKSCFIEKLVEDGVLSKAQAQELREALRAGHRHKQKEN